MEIRKRLSPRGVLKEDNLVIHFLSPLLFLFFFWDLFFFLGYISPSLFWHFFPSLFYPLTPTLVTQQWPCHPSLGQEFSSHHRNLNKLLPLAEAQTYTHTCEFLARGFGGTGQSFLSPTTLLCFIVNYPWSVTWISVSVFLHEPPLRPPPTFLYSNPDRKEVPVALNVTVQVNLCPAVTASIEGCLSSRILTNYHFKS